MTTQQTSVAPPRSTVSLIDMRQTFSQTRPRFTKTRGVPKITREGEIEPDFITLISLISETYRSLGNELEPVRQFHPSRETLYSKGHTSSVSHTEILRHVLASKESHGGKLTREISEDIIIKRPRKNILEPETYALISFITELRVRTNRCLREHPNIAQLRGVGWDFEDEESTIPRPLLLEELAPQGSLANFWARWNFVRLNYKSKLDLARDIAEGIQAMHDCGVVHGDVKPENILIFPKKDADNKFVAKLTDFGHSVFKYGRSKSLPAFTPQWCAPELLPDGSGPQFMGFHDMKLTDTYSYGLVVLSIMISRPFYISIEDFETPKSNGTILREAIELVSREDREKHDSDLDLATTEALMRQTIRLRPEDRNLEHYDKINGHRVWGYSHDGTSRKQIVKELNVTELVAIGHSTFSRASHQLKAYIVNCLMHISNDRRDPRQLTTAWELSICYFSGFGVEISFRRSSKWLSVASEGGVAAAQDYAAILHEAMDLPYKLSPMQVNECRIPTAVSECQSKVQGTGPKFECLENISLQEREYESDTEDILKPSTYVSKSKKMPNDLLDILNTGTLQGLQTYLRDNPEGLNKYLLNQADVDAGVPNRSGHTVLHFLPPFDDETTQQLVSKLAQRRANLQREAQWIPLESKDVVLLPEIRCCSILNAILHGNLTLLRCLLEAAHAEGATSQCHICEAASRFRRILAVSLSIFQAGALAMLIAHVRDRGNLRSIRLKTIKVWDGNKLVPLHKVPFNSVAVRSLDFPDSLFRAINYGRRYARALEDTITFLLSTEETVEDLAYSMITEAVDNNNWEAVRFLLDEGEKRRFIKSWWVRFPLKDSPFMRSISLGFRETFELFLQHDSTILQRIFVLPCCAPYCKMHKRKLWDRYIRVLLGHSEAVLLPASERTHSYNTVQCALLQSINSSHQDSFFIGFLERAILTSAFSTAKTIVDRFPDIFQTRPDQSFPCIWRSLRKSNIHGSSQRNVLEILRRGSYEQCRFIMERLLPLRAHKTSSNIANELLPRANHNSPSQGESVQDWTRCPLSREEYNNLVTGNIGTKDNDRERLWVVVEAQVKLGHSRSVSYLRQAILYGNLEALKEMLRQGWDPNGPLWARLYTPLQYIQHLMKLQNNFNELFKAWNPDLPQTDWKDSRTHALVYGEYRRQRDAHNWNEWRNRLKASEAILREHGGSILPVVVAFSRRKQTLRAWALAALVLVYGLLLPLTFTYATESTWASTSKRDKLSFSYLWSLLSVSLPPAIKIWKGTFPTNITDGIITGLLLIINQIIFPILVIRFNWSPLLRCNDNIIYTGVDGACNVVTECTNDYSMLLFVAAIIEGGLWFIFWFLY
ncbi:hypothetical protein F5Y10DRAFT_291400 [Nemania abortiva]|nr:hypothetical protein F5Y10DRAFT_291400 [Nemania abortiva]